MNGTQAEPQRRKKRYDLNFKRSAVELWLGGGKSAEQVATELGISGQTLKTWKQQLVLPPPISQAQTLEQLQEENRRLRRELTGALRRCDILKNLGHPLRTQRERFERIKAMSTGHSIRQLCAALGVSRSGYQVWSRRRPSLRAQADADLLGLLRQGHEESRGTYGRPRLLVWLAQRGHRCGHSMSRRGNCYDNAAIFEWIEVFYNRTRFYSALGYKPPVDFENQIN
jgi:transposase-like protein